MKVLVILLFAEKLVAHLGHTAESHEGESIFGLSDREVRIFENRSAHTHLNPKKLFWQLLPENQQKIVEG